MLGSENDAERNDAKLISAKIGSCTAAVIHFKMLKATTGMLHSLSVCYVIAKALS